MHAMTIRRIIWSLGLVALIIWTLLAWAGWALLGTGGDWLGSQSGALVPESLAPLLPGLVDLAQALGYTAIIIGWALSAGLLLTLTALGARLLGGPARRSI